MPEKEFEGAQSYDALYKNGNLMISTLTGKMTYKFPDHCIIDVGGVGYMVNTSFSTFDMLPEPGSNLSLNIYTYVREDQLQLYGFFTPEEKRVFQRLISISGVGPKMALAILSGLPCKELLAAILHADNARLCAIPGVGRKTAERIILELRDKLSKDMGTSSSCETQKHSLVRDDAVSALVNLGYKKQVAEGTVLKIKVNDEMKIEELIKMALRELNRI